MTPNGLSALFICLLASQGPQAVAMVGDAWFPTARRPIPDPKILLCRIKALPFALPPLSSFPILSCL